MRLTADVALVGGGIFGFDLTGPADCNVYLLDGGDEIALVDTGAALAPADTDRLMDRITASGFAPARIGRILLTHYHTDHVGGAAALHERLGVPIHASPLTAEVLSQGDEERNGLEAAKRAGFFPADYSLRTCPTNGDLVEGQSFTVGSLSITPYETPGHAAGHLSFLVEGKAGRGLVQGDVVFFGGTILLQNIADCSIQDYAASVAKLAELDFEGFFPGHLGFSVTNGKRHVLAAHETFSRLGIPRNVV